MLTLPASSPLSSRLHRWLAGGVRVISWALLVAGLLLGIAWAALHFWIVPRIADFRPALESLARQSLGVPVRIGGLSAQSTGWVPSFELRDIALLDSQGRTALSLPRVVVAISLRSVLQLRLDQLVLDAPELDVRLSADGRWQVAGLDWPQAHQGNSTAADWLFSQREVVVRGGRLRWSRETAPAQRASANSLSSPEVITLGLQQVDLVLRNSPRHHDLRVDATPPDGWGERFVLMGRFRRSLLSTHAGQWADWSGQAYAYFPQVDVAQLHPHIPEAMTSGVRLEAGLGQVRLWSDIDKGHWTGGMADVNLIGLNAQLAPQRPALVFERFSGRLGGKVHAKGFEFFTRDLAFVDAQGLDWPGGNLALEYTHAQGKQPAKGRIQADQLDLLTLREMVLRMPVAKALHDRLQEQSIAGQVSALQWRWQGDWQQPTQYEAQLSVKNLLLRHSAPSPDTLSWPGLQGADVKLNLTQAGGQMDLRMAPGGMVFLPGVLALPEVPVRSLQAFAQWEKKNGPNGPLWQVPQWRLKLVNADLQGEWHGQWRENPTGQGPGLLDLQGLIQQADAASAHRYLPVVLPESIRHYVRDAVVKGSYTGVKVRIKGDLAKLPFASRQDGELLFSGRLKDVEFDMVPAALLPKNSLAWPRLRGLQGQLSFDRLGMKLTEASARLGDAKTGPLLSGGTAEIAEMGRNPLLQVSTEGKGNASQLLTVVQQSPLDAMLSGALRDTQANGPVQWRLKLGLPLLALENSQVQGSVTLGGNDVRINPATPWLEKVQGQLQFSESGFVLSGAKARLLGGPIQIEGGLRTASSPGADPSLMLQVQGQVSAEGLRAAKDFEPLDGLAHYLSGTTPYSAKLGWRQGQPELTVQSTLEGLAIALPAPLGKTANASLPLSMQIRSVGQSPLRQDQIQVKLGSVAAVHYVRDLTGAQARVLRGSLALGVAPGQVPVLPESGVTASAAFDQLLVDDWLALLPTGGQSPIGQAAGAGAAAWQSYLPTRMGLQANSLTAQGRTLHQVVAGGTREGNLWQANVDARELNGHLTFKPSSNTQQGQLFARLSRLNLPPSAASEVESLLETPPAQLPALDIVVDELELRGKKLGRVEIEAINTEPGRNSINAGNEWQLKKFNITLPEGNLRSTGRWLAARGGSSLRKTEMNFVLDVKNAGDLLTRLGTPDALRGGTGQLEGNVSWQGSPLSLHYPSMDGRFDVRMGRGQFLKADAGAAKLLGVLSLQALPRRLLLDFRDVFSEGFAFDSVRGEVSIAHGMASTHNLQIKGVNALVQLDGSADIARETQKLRVVILPEVDAGTASLLAGIALNPMVGLTTFLAQLFLQNPLSRASTQEFLIDGSWADPRVTRVDPRAPAPGAAPASAP